ncbi:MAG TPA: adenylate/guanylate cyclase domain-containing protein, partial [Leptospiraceae bacterium]|nr:adenylate/guanylate cyclase domain-containing protein [Leptospiraceae bacterium]
MLSATLLKTTLELLRDHLGTTGISYRAGGQVIYESGRIAGGGPVAFMNGELFTGLFDKELSANERGAIRTAARMLEVFQGAAIPARGPNAISASLIAKSTFEIAVSLEARSRQLAHYDKILQLNKSILLAQDLQGVLQILMDTAREALTGVGSSLLLVDPRTGELYFNVVSGEKGGELKEIRIPPGKGIAGDVVQKAKAELIRDAVTDPRMFQEVDQKLDQRTRDMVVAPLVARDRVIGVVEVINSQSPEGFTKEDLEFLVNIASHTSLLIDNAKNRDDLIKSNHALDRKISELNAFSEVSRVLNSTLDSIEMRKGLLRTLLKLMHIGQGAIVIPDPTGRRAVSEVRMRLKDGRLEEYGELTVYEDTADILLWMKQNREPLFFANSQGGETEGLVRRFLSANASLEGEHLDLWFPVFQDDQQTVSFIVSLSDVSFRRKHPSDDLTFFKGIMSLSYAAVRNVESYQNVIKAQEREERIRRGFQRYVPERVVEEVFAQEESPAPRSQKVSVLFADIRNFTRHAENRDPGELLDLLNEFFEEMVEAVTHAGGTVDKFMGDSIMVLFGVPDPTDVDAKSALTCARDMIGRLDVLNRRREESSRPTFQVGIGVHTGSAIIGNMGARKRMDFTAVGDTINLGARLEQLTKLYQVRALFSEDTLKEAGDVTCREVDLIQVRGRMAVTRIYQLATNREEDEMIRASAEVWPEMLKAYRMRNFWDCLQILISLPNDPLAGVFRARCESFVKNPPPADWKGFYH